MTEIKDLGLKDAGAGCACCATTSSTADTVTAAEAAVTQNVLVDGMTCSHCVSSVTDQLTSIAGVENVVVDLNVGGSSQVTIHSATLIDADAVKVAVEEAGYSLAGVPA